MYFLGLDGGGTGCRAALCDDTGRRLGEGRAGPANIATDYDMARANILAACSQAMAGICPPSAVRAVLGVAGANLSGAGQQLAASMPFAHLRVVQDIVISVRGALHNDDGIVAALGTGSVFARQLDGEIRSVGGWGLRLGDEGSGAWIGRAILMRATRALDGLVAATPLLATLCGEMGGGPGIVSFSLHATPADYAALVPRVLAARNDPAAHAVLEAARAEIRALIAHLQPDGACLPVCWLGGLGPTLALPDWPVRTPLGTAVDGALWMAQEEKEWPI
ncbi:BadF/BadG/BcrA/BcrD ATPase family protein [Paenirhodobacter sp. CAU 1674]|uniref:BadF/BadG/BcrA/BcrD ATPase family protein n=1 Tax=Paenirhodobacter sp. CAU 1674 TaxID=3032596 RepID=UPI0023DCC2F8|nr:BadF/BadG/BcrA/BcrD ATPase family protein [Paenirhodobacter sp. CAU 1674]MDF2140490.1 BadF/BadG/BcrA/BcrD ATPase family protein [Paenirhodobacter sp. CAU 1674]